MSEIFRVGLTRDCLRADGRIPVIDPVALDRLKSETSLAFEFMLEACEEVTPEQASPYHAIVVMKPRNIGHEAFRLLRPLEMVHLAYDPEAAAELGVRLVDFATVLREADFLIINCPLSPETRHLIGAREIGLMKPSAFLINTARGPIVDAAALIAALAEKRIAGAALDVFAEEPVATDNPLLGLDNVITTPHLLCWTEECFRRIAEDAFASVVAVARGVAPVSVVNRVVLDHPAFTAALAARRLGRVTGVN